MVTKTINLNAQAEELLERMKENDPDFNFSRFIQEALEEDDTRLTEDQLKHKIKEAELELETAKLKLSHLKSVIPLVRKNEEETNLIRENQLKSSLETLRRVKLRDGEERFNEILPIHAKMTNKSLDELRELVITK